MENTPKHKSEENLERVETLTRQLGFSSIRLMVDPQKSASAEAVIDDVRLFLEEEANGNRNSTPVFSFSM